MGSRELLPSGFEDGPHAIPRRARLRDRREDDSPSIVLRAVVAGEEQPPPLAGHHETGMAGPGRILTAALHDGSLGNPLLSVERRGHVQASDIAIGSRVDHQVPVLVAVSGGSGVDRYPQPFPRAAPALNCLEYPRGRAVVA